MKNIFNVLLTIFFASILSFNCLNAQSAKLVGSSIKFEGEYFLIEKSAFIFASNDSAKYEFSEYEFYAHNAEKKSEFIAFFGGVTLVSATIIFINRPDPGLAGLDESIMNIGLAGVGALSFFITFDSIIRGVKYESKANHHLLNAVDIINDQSILPNNSLGIGITTNGLGIIYTF